MTALSKAALQALWVQFFQPTQADFANLIDSWTDYSPALEVLGTAVSGGSTGVPNVVSSTSVAFVALGATGSALMGAGTAASARTVLALGALATRNTVSAANIDAASVSAAAIVDNAITLAKIARVGTSGQSLISGGAGKDASYAWTGFVQRVTTTQGGLLSGTTQTPVDNTIPQITEGTEFLSATITPRSADNILRIEATLTTTNAAGGVTSFHIHRASSADAIFAVANRPGSNDPGVVTVVHHVTANSTSPTAFQVRVGPNSSTTVYLNGNTSGVQIFGGTCLSSMTITEIAP
jgi:hypothetical protein